MNNSLPDIDRAIEENKRNLETALARRPLIPEEVRLYQEKLDMLEVKRDEALNGN